jgi:hypothetical protein
VVVQVISLAEKKIKKQEGRNNELLYIIGIFSYVGEEDPDIYFKPAPNQGRLSFTGENLAHTGNCITLIPYKSYSPG